MSYIGKNIKKIRSVKKLSQQAFADLFDLSRANIGSYEEGRAEPKINVVIQIANKFGIDVEHLLNNELRVNDIIKFGKRTVPENDDLPGLNPDGHGKLIPYIALGNIATYLNNLDSEEYLKYMPRFEIPHFKHAKSRAFEIKGNDLLYQNTGLFPGDILICIGRDAKKISELAEGKLYAFVFSNTIVIRRLYFGQGVFELYADNAFYDEQIVRPDEIVELWEAHTLITSKGGLLMESRPIAVKTKESAD